MANNALQRTHSRVTSRAGRAHGPRGAPLNRSVRLTESEGERFELMTEKIPKTAFYNIKAREHYIPAMRRDVQLLREHTSWTTCMTVVLCCIDTLAAGNGDADRGKFKVFCQTHFPDLCAALDGTVPGKTGSDVLYDKFRNGFAHLRGPKSCFGLTQGPGLAGRYVVELEVEGGGTFFAIDVERFIGEFLALAKRLEDGAA